MLKQLHFLQSNNTRLFFTGVLLFLSLTSVSEGLAQGNLLINPKRVLFDGQKRFQEINLANTGKDTARYAISFIQIRMSDDGRFEEIKEPVSGQRFASNNLRVFPRSVTLAPAEAQIVKVQVSQPDKLIPGEYRSHIYFRAVPNERSVGEKSSKKDTGNVSVRLTPVFGISIPVIIRVGASDTQVNLSNVTIETLADSSTILNARFNRTGNMSVYGDLTVEYISDGGKKTRVGLVKGISVYTPNKIRDFKIKLENKAGVNYRSGKLDIIYTGPIEEKSERFASAEVLLN